MDRFGSSRLRMVWAGVCLLLAGLVLASVQGFGEGGTQLMVCGAGIPLGFEDPKPYVIQNLARIVYSVVPAVILLGGFIPLGEWLASGSRAERYRGLLVGTALGFVHGLFLGQVALLPVLAASFRLLGNPFAPSIMLADLNAVILGLQMLLWAAALGLLLKSNRGLAVLMAYGLNEVGRIMAWGGEFLGDLDVPKAIVKGMALLGKSLPSGQLPSDPLAWTALPLSLGVPLVLAALLLLLPAKAAKRSRA
ncbi:MAG: hypothetical protein P4L36_18845 [Holophaga sp.]|nr:hypothetical protein [Holophaga sp.]